MGYSISKINEKKKKHPKSGGKKEEREKRTVNESQAVRYQLYPTHFIIVSRYTIYTVTVIKKPEKTMK